MTFLISSIGSFLLFANYHQHTLVEMASWIFRSFSACSVSGTNTPLRLVISYSSAGVSRIVQILCLLVSLIILLSNSFSKCRLYLTNLLLSLFVLLLVLARFSLYALQVWQFALRIVSWSQSSYWSIVSFQLVGGVFLKDDCWCDFCSGYSGGSYFWYSCWEI